MVTDNPMFENSGEFVGEIPVDCVKACTHAGDCSADVVSWADILNFEVPAPLARNYLYGFGAWDDLENCSQSTLNERVLWLACCEIKENGEWFGLID